MNFQDFSLELKFIKDDKDHFVEGINFRNTCFIKIFIDKIDILYSAEFEGSTLVFSELTKSLSLNKESNRYLIFTSYNGVADALGWDYITIEKNNFSYEWNFERDGKSYSYLFSKDQYVEEVEKIRKKLLLKSKACLLYTSPSPRDQRGSRMPSSA